MGSAALVVPERNAEAGPSVTPQNPQELFEQVHALLDSGPRSLVPMQNAIRAALGLPPRFGYRCGHCGVDVDENQQHPCMEVM